VRERVERLLAKLPRYASEAYGTKESKVGPYLRYEDVVTLLEWLDDFDAYLESLDDEQPTDTI